MILNSRAGWRARGHSGKQSFAPIVALARPTGKPVGRPFVCLVCRCRRRRRLCSLSLSPALILGPVYRSSSYRTPPAPPTRCSQTSNRGPQVQTNARASERALFSRAKSLTRLNPAADASCFIRRAFRCASGAQKTLSFSPTVFPCERKRKRKPYQTHTTQTITLLSFFSSSQSLSLSCRRLLLRRRRRRLRDDNRVRCTRVGGPKLSRLAELPQIVRRVLAVRVSELARVIAAV